MKIICFKIILSLLGLIGLTLSCTEQKNKKEKSINFHTIRVNNPNEQPLIKLSTYFKKGKIIPLETTGECLLSEIKKVVLYKDCYWVADEENKSGVFCFGANGKFLYRIGQKGQGPEEFIDLTDFSIDKEKGVVYIYDNWTQKVLVYNEKGTYQRSIFIGESSSAFEYNNNRFYFSRNNPVVGVLYNLFITDMQGKIISKFFPSDETQIRRRPQFRLSGEDLYYYPNMSADTIYSITDVPVVGFKMDFGKYTIPPEVLYNKILNQEESLKRVSWKIFRDNDYIAGIKDFYPIGNLLIFKYNLRMVGYTGIYEIEKDECVHSLFVQDDICYIGSLINLIGTTKDQMLLAVNYDDIAYGIKLIQGDYFKKNNLITPEQIPATVASLEKLKNELEEDCNPILIVYDLK